MTLQEILFKNRSVPNVKASRSIRGVDAIGQVRCHDGKQSEQPRDSEWLKPNERRVLNMLRRHKREIGPDEVAERLALSKSYCNVILLTLVELGKAARRKEGLTYFYRAVKIHGA